MDMELMNENLAVLPFCFNLTANNKYLQQS